MDVWTGGRSVGEGVDTIGPPKNSILNINYDYTKEKKVFYRFQSYCKTAKLISLGCDFISNQRKTLYEIFNIDKRFEI